MILAFIALIGIALWSCKITWRGFHADYLDKKSTGAICGLFILWVFIRHVQSPYLIEFGGYQYSLLGDNLFLYIDKVAGQLIVVMFLFYSGFGVTTSIIMKGNEYIRSMPLCRIGVTYVNFVIAVLAFIVASLVCGDSISIKKCALSLIALDGVGNSYWYVFCILCCYTTAFVSSLLLKVFKIRLHYVCIGIGFGVFVYIMVMAQVKPLYWYSTASAFAFGSVYASFRTGIEKTIAKAYWLSLFTAGFLFYCLWFRVGFNFYGLRENVAAIVFAFGFVLVSMKLKLCNPVICWLGAHLFPIYIYQRLPMMLIDNASNHWLVTRMPYLFVLLTFVATLLIAQTYFKWQVKVR